MKRALVVEFTKMTGAGNDFIVIDNRFFHFTDEELAAFAARFCKRRLGIGADGLLALNPATSSEHHFRMRYFNADGSPATMCGNGARCLAKFAYEGGIEASPLVFETDAGVYRAQIAAGSDRVRLSMTDPRDYRPVVRLSHPRNAPVSFIWTGTEHAVTFVDNLDDIDVEREGSRIRRDPAFGAHGANANFVEVLGEGDAIRLRTFEKGVEAETPACGTGAVASAIVTRLARRSRASSIDVHVRGGMLRVSFSRDDDGIRNVEMEGPAEAIFRGSFEWGG